MALARNLTAKIYDIKAHDGLVTSLDLGETGRVLVTGGQDRNVNLWAIGQDECFMSLTGHNRPIECVKFAYNDDFVYSADDIGIIRRWDLNSETIYSTLNGHMKSVRTLDFNPSGDYVISGSNDTTVRLWNVHKDNKCIKTYRGHISHVNCVKFSPDGLWIASAGSEGSVLIWDIRKSEQIMDFTEEDSAVSITCIQFHPFEFLLAVGRIDGTVCIYDLENKTRISRTESTSQFYGYPIKCITFSEHGDCLFVATAAGISVIGWEPDREFDNIKSTWTSLGDMKIVNKKLICGCFDKEYVAVNAVSIDRVIPFYNPSNILPTFNHNSSNRKSFTRRKQKLCFPLSGTTPSRLVEENEDYKSLNFDEQHQNSKFDLLEEPNSDIIDESIIDLTQSPVPSLQHYINPITSDQVFNSTYSLGDDILTNYENTEMAEDFPVNQNVHQEQGELGTYNNSVPSSVNNLGLKLTKKSSHISQKRGTHYNTAKQNISNFGSNKLGQISSISSMELHKLDDNLILKKSASSYLVVNKNKRSVSSQIQINKENTRSKNINVQIVTKPPLRSRTSLDMRSGHHSKQEDKHSHDEVNFRPDLIPTTGRSINRNTDDHYDMHILSTSHELIFQELSNRNASLQLIRNSTRSHDLTAAIKQANKMSSRSVLVDLLGAILEKPSSWNLDFCLLVLPELYELLQSPHKFHYTRACDTLRVILSNFLPVIQENLDPWANGLGVDVTREDRQRKCIECQRWLLQIRNLPDINHFGNALTQLQNMIIL